MNGKTTNTACIVLHNHWMGSKGFEKIMMNYTDRKAVFDRAKGLCYEKTTAFNRCDYSVVFDIQDGNYENGGDRTVFPSLMMCWKYEKDINDARLGFPALVLGGNLQGYIVVCGSNGGTVVDKYSHHEVTHCEYATPI